MANKILIVDDEPGIVKSIEHGLKSYGYEIITAFDGQTALEKVRQEKPNLILLDLMLPKFNGYELCNMIGLDEEYKDIPVIILTGCKDGKNIRAGMDGGAAAYITKPFEIEELLGIVQGLLGEPPQ